MPSESVTLNYNLKLKGTEIRAIADVPSALNDQDRRVLHSNYVATGSLDATSTPVVDRVTFSEITTGGGITTIDLTAASTVNGTEDFSGKKLVAVGIEAGSANTGIITVTYGAANPYLIFGSGGKVLLNKGETLNKTIRSGSDNSNAVVSGTVKNIDVSSSAGAGDTVNLILYFGT